MNHHRRRKLTLYYKDIEYRFLWVSSTKEACEWMQKETQLMPCNKKHLYYFTIEARQHPCRKTKQKNSD